VWLIAAEPGITRLVNRVRYEGYVAVKDAIADEMIDFHAGDVIRDLAEGLLLARDGEEAERARENAPGVLLRLVEEGFLSRSAAHRFFVRVRACGPEMHWPPSWQRRRVPLMPRWAVRGSS
jgi:hypothetical protein